MKKGIKLTGIILLSFFLLVIVAAFILPYLISLDKYKGMVEKELGQALHRDCSIGRLRISILPTLGARIEDVVISNPPGFSQTPLLSLKSLKVRVKVIPLLYGRKEIAGLTLDRPVVFIEKDPQGRLNIPYMEAAGKTERKGTLESAKIKTDESKALQDLYLSKASLKGGKFIYLDRTTTPANRTEIEEIDLDVRDVSLDKRIQYKLSLQWSPNEISLAGWVGPLGRTIDLKNIPLQGRLQIDFPDLASLMKKLSGGGAATLEGALKADLNFEEAKGSSFKTNGEITLKDVSISQAIRMKGLVALAGNLTVPVQGNPLFSLEANSSHFDITLVEKKRGAEKETPSKKKPGGKKQAAHKGGLDAKGRLRIKEGTFQGTDFHNLLVAGEMKGGEVKITQFTCSAFKGTVQGDGSLDMARDPSPFRMKAKVTDVDVDTLVNAFSSSKNVLKGKLNGDVTLGGAGLSFDTLKQNLTGDGEVQIKDGEIPWLNIINNIVRALGGKGGGKEKEKTTFDDLNTVFTIKNGMVSIPNLLISQKDTAIKLQGGIGLDSTLKMEGEAHLPPSVTGDLTGKGWNFLMDNQGRLTIPFTLRGAVTDPKVGISTKLIEQGVKGMLEDFLQKKQQKK